MPVPQLHKAQHIRWLYLLIYILNSATKYPGNMDTLVLAQWSIELNALERYKSAGFILWDILVVHQQTGCNVYHDHHLV